MDIQIISNKIYLKDILLNNLNIDKNPYLFRFASTSI